MRKRALIAALLIILYLILAFVEFHREVIAPIFCLAIALVMFWPMPRDKQPPSELPEHKHS
jgi:hypothetical protein